MRKACLTPFVAPGFDAACGQGRAAALIWISAVDRETE